MAGLNKLYKDDLGCFVFSVVCYPGHGRRLGFPLNALNQHKISTHGTASVSALCPRHALHSSPRRVLAGVLSHDLPWVTAGRSMHGMHRQTSRRRLHLLRFRHLQRRILQLDPKVHQRQLYVRWAGQNRLRGHGQQQQQQQGRWQQQQQQPQWRWQQQWRRRQ